MRRLLIVSLALLTLALLTLALAGAASAAPAPAGPQPGGYRFVHAVPAAGFGDMVGFTPVPGSPNSAIVVQKSGVLWRVQLHGGQPVQFADFRSLMLSNLGSEEGLLGFAFSPNYAKDHRIYVDYTAPSRGSSGRQSLLVRYRVKAGRVDLDTGRILLHVYQPFENHNGGQLKFGPDNMLYYSLGDGGAGGDPFKNGQNLGTLLGKILRLDVSGPGTYRVPRTNPFVGRAGARPEIWAYGLRNPWRFSFDRKTGALWVGDVGQESWEEVDHIRRGGNYGWNVMEGSHCYAASPCDRSGKILPRAEYSHSFGCSITGGYVYRGKAMPQLQGWFIYGDYCSGRVWAVNTQGRGRPVEIASAGANITSWGELPSGELVAVTFGGGLLRLTRK